MKNFLFVLIIILTPFFLRAEEEVNIDSLIIILKAEQQDALNKGSHQQFKEIGAKLERLSTFGEKGWLTSYYLSCNYYRMSNLTENKEEREKYVEAAKKTIEKSIESKGDFSESHALYSSILGLGIGLKPYLGMKNGMKSGNEIAKAYELEPNNPRIYLIDGISVLYTPKVFGGGGNKALAKFNKAVELYKEEKRDRGIYPDWGRDNVFIWLGKVYEKKGEKEKTIRFYKKALEVNPNNGWAKKLLFNGDTLLN